MTQQPDMPPVEQRMAIQKGGTIDTLNDLGMSGDTTPGTGTCTPCGRQGRANPRGATVAPSVFFDSTKPEILIDEN